MSPAKRCGDGRLFPALRRVFQPQLGRYHIGGSSEKIAAGLGRFTRRVNRRAGESPIGAAAQSTIE